MASSLVLSSCAPLSHSLGASSSAGGLRRAAHTPALRLAPVRLGRRTHVSVRAAAGGPGGSPGGEGPASDLPRDTPAARAASRQPQEEGLTLASTSAIAPLAPSTGAGQLLLHLLGDGAAPGLFDAALDEQIAALAAQHEADLAADAAAAEAEAAAAAAAAAPAGDASGLVLRKRILALKAAERTAALEEALYALVVRRFTEIECGLLPPLAGGAAAKLTRASAPRPARADRLLGVHSEAAQALVREHIGMITAGMPQAPGQLLSLPLIGVSQIYRATASFGLLCRAMDRRFALEQAFGLPAPAADAAARLGELGDAAAAGAAAEAAHAERAASSEQALPSSSAGADETEEDAELVAARARLEGLYARSSSGSSSSSSSSSGAASAGFGSPHGLGGASPLKSYIVSLPDESRVAAMQPRSAVGRAVLDRHLASLFGDAGAQLEALKRAIGEVASPEELRQKTEDALKSGAIEALVLSPSALLRLVMEACALGSFLADAELELDAIWPGGLAAAV